jgi:hypothetical protein
MTCEPRVISNRYACTAAAPLGQLDDVAVADADAVADAVAEPVAVAALVGVAVGVGDPLAFTVAAS